MKRTILEFNISAERLKGLERLTKAFPCVKYGESSEAKWSNGQLAVRHGKEVVAGVALQSMTQRLTVVVPESAEASVLPFSLSEDAKHNFVLSFNPHADAWGTGRVDFAPIKLGQAAS